MVTETGRDRGQLLLVGGIILGIVILGSVVLLNDMKFNDTIGSQGNQQALEDATRATDAIEEDLTGLRERVRDGTSRSNFDDAFAENVSIYSNTYSNMTFEDGIVYVDVTYSEAASVDGRLLSQRLGPSGNGREFRLNPNPSPSNDWTMADDATLLSPFNVTVTNFRPVGTTASTTFVVTGSESRTWELKMNSTDSGVGPSGITGPSLYTFVDGDLENAQAVSSGVDVDLVDGTVDGSQVNGFAFAEYVSPPYTVEVDNDNPSGLLPRGTYRLGTDSTVRSTSASQPTVEDYEAVIPAVNVTYQRPELQYVTTIYLNATGGGN